MLQLICAQLSYQRVRLHVYVDLLAQLRVVRCAYITLDGQSRIQLSSLHLAHVQ